MISSHFSMTKERIPDRKKGRVYHTNIAHPRTIVVYYQKKPIAQYVKSVWISSKKSNTFWAIIKKCLRVWKTPDVHWSIFKMVCQSAINELKRRWHAGSKVVGFFPLSHTHIFFGTHDNQTFMFLRAFLYIFNRRHFKYQFSIFWLSSSPKS